MSLNFSMCGKTPMSYGFTTDMKWPDLSLCLPSLTYLPGVLLFYLILRAIKQKVLFSDPNVNQSRYQKLTFEISENCMLHGFVGYFETTLYGSVKLSKLRMLSVKRHITVGSFILLPVIKALYPKLTALECSVGFPFSFPSKLVNTHGPNHLEPILFFIFIT